MPKTKVLIVDDSAVMRHFLSNELSSQPGIEVVGTAPDAFVARSKIINLKPDVITIDIQMPKINGLTLIKKIMKHYPVPIVVFSSYTRTGAELTLNALDAGAMDYVQKPSSMLDAPKTVNLLARKIKNVSKIDLSRLDQTENNEQGYEASAKQGTIDERKIIAIGASTGGTVAIKKILSKIPRHFAPIVIVQHMPAYFTKTFAETLNSFCAIEVKEAEDNDKLCPGKALIAPGDYHMELKKNNKGYFVKINQKGLVNNQRPSVEVLFNSVVETAGKNSIGVILTGMGSDGAKGLLEMKKAGAYTIAQDKNSSVVFGMPKQAIKLGAVLQVASLSEMPSILTNLLRS